VQFSLGHYSLARCSRADSNSAALQKFRTAAAIAELKLSQKALDYAKPHADPEVERKLALYRLFRLPSRGRGPDRGARVMLHESAAPVRGFESEKEIAQCGTVFLLFRRLCVAVRALAQVMMFGSVTAIRRSIFSKGGPAAMAAVPVRLVGWRLFGGGRRAGGELLREPVARHKNFYVRIGPRLLFSAR
jgi:hypothetical protein